jgi:valyl-tRNA synthetase
MIAPWPQPGETDAEAEAEFSLLIEIVRAIRTARAEAGVEPAKWIAATISAGPHADALASQREILSRLARVADDELTIAAHMDAPGQATALVVADTTVYLTGMVDVEAERARLRRELEDAEAQAERVRAQLANDNFVSRARPDVVQGARDRLAAFEERATRLRTRLAALSED